MPDDTGMSARAKPSDHCRRIKPIRRRCSCRVLGRILSERLGSGSAGSAGFGTWTLTGVGTIVSQDHLHCEIQWPVTGGTATLAYSHRKGGIQDLTADPVTIIVKVPIQILATDNGVLTLGGKVTLSVTGNYTYQSYKWLSEDGTVLSTDATLTVREPGKYGLQVVLANGTLVTAAYYTVTRMKLGDNYVLSHTVRSPVGSVNVETLPVETALRQIEYYDGLGRPLQSVAIQGSPGKTDVVTPRQYDAYGREPIAYLPYASTEVQGKYKPDAVSSANGYTGSSQYAFYTNANTTVARSTKPYSETQFRPSPLNQVVKQGAPGEAWQPQTDPALDRSVRSFQEVNNENEVLYFQYDVSTRELRWQNNNTLAYYEKNSLYAARIQDEHGNDVIVYTDREGKMLLRRVQRGNTAEGAKLYADTYYIYDDGGNLVYVLPPEAVHSLTGSN